MRDYEFTIENDMLALDKRTVDLDGRMHVTDCIISKAVVNDYLGSEIPNFEALKLDPNKTYRLYRDAAALKAAVPTFENQPLMDNHVAVSSSDPQKSRIVGTLSNVRFEAPDLLADIAVWDASAIERIRDGSQKGISAGYRYTPIMRSGVSPDGESYDGIMSGPIVCNHVALVQEPRVGRDVVVADSARTMADLIPGLRRLGLPR
jgi:hypothetical protein